MTRGQSHNNINLYAKVQYAKSEQLYPTQMTNILLNIKLLNVYMRVSWLTCHMQHLNYENLEDTCEGNKRSDNFN